MARNSRADRAKIFAPFDALKGLQDTLTEQETCPISRIELSNDAKEELDYKLRNINGNPVLTVTFYSFLNQQYLQITGKVVKLSYSARTIQIDNTRISFKDIHDIRNESIDEI